MTGVSVGRSWLGLHRTGSLKVEFILMGFFLRSANMFMAWGYYSGVIFIATAIIVKAREKEKEMGFVWMKYLGYGY